MTRPFFVVKHNRKLIFYFPEYLTSIIKVRNFYIYDLIGRAVFQRDLFEEALNLRSLCVPYLPGAGGSPES